MIKLVAIGGGEIGRPGYPIETLSIDKEVISLSGKPKPNLLFLPTASNDDAGYDRVIKDYYGKRLGCNVETLLLNDKPSAQRMRAAVAAADIIYVGGGNTLRMMNVWRKTGMDKLLLEARYNKVLAGISAGAICWFKTGLSDSRKYTSNGKTWPYINVRGLGLYDVDLCPHYDTDLERQPSLKHSLKRSQRTAIALEDCTALEIVGETYRIISSKNNKKAYKAYWKEGKYFMDTLKPSSEYSPLPDLLRKA